MTDDGHGKTYGRFTLPTAQAAMLATILRGFAAPKHVAATEGPGIIPRPGPERMGRAFCEFIERYPVDRVPDAGGTSATAVVIIPLETLMGGLKRDRHGRPNGRCSPWRRPAARGRALSVLLRCRACRASTSILLSP